ncbi:hypothetical protein HKK55_11160 [Pseudomonas sp. ADAK18]|uniref:hypothetical protein n=1 Tax=Pseudomonas sp. ADAK18 TaxID=2730848 RepID=UPI00146308D2|nr:hypothetical protein [Pseudomonas sp. ADAK18]QJI29249.1 hypothetical protein HKK55_11160 [Pseudomonas sp. ADAK18]
MISPTIGIAHVHQLFPQEAAQAHSVGREKRASVSSEVPALANNAEHNGDRKLANLYAQALQEGIKTGAVPEFLENIPKDSTFGKWWSHLCGAIKNPSFIAWAKSKNIDLSKPIDIHPSFDQIACTISGKRQTLWGPEQDSRWSTVTAPLMHAVKVVGAGREVTAPTSSTSAPFVAVAQFYGEPRFPISTQIATKRSAELQQQGAFNKIPLGDTTRAAEIRSDSALDSAKTALGDSQNQHALTEKLQSFPRNGSRRLDEYLKNTLLSVHPDSTYSKQSEPVDANAVSLETFISNSGWRLPNSQDELANLIRVLITPSLPEVSLGNLGGALSWKIPLSSDQKKWVYSHVTHNNVGLPDLGEQFRVTGALGYLSRNLHWSASELRNPGRVIEQIVDSPKAQALGKALQEKMGALSTEKSNQDWILTAIATTLDSESIFNPKKNHVAGFDLASGNHYGQPLGAIKQGLIDHLVARNKTTVEMAPIGAHLLLSHAAPELLVRDIPDGVTYGSMAWVSLKAAVARIEAQSPGTSAKMTFAEVILRDANDPISADDDLIQSQARRSALIEWGEINGVFPKSTTGVYSQSHVDLAQQAIAEKTEQLSKVSPALRAEIPTQKSIALKALKEAFGEGIPFERNCINSNRVTQDSHYLTPSLTTEPTGDYSMLDLYLSGRAADPVGWFSTDKDVPISYMLNKLVALQKPKGLHEKVFAEYESGIKNAYVTLTKNLISQLPLEDRKNIEYGKINVYVDGEVTRTTSFLPGFTHVHESSFPEQPLKERVLLIKTERNDETTFYEISPQHGRIRRRDDLKSGFLEGVQERWVERPSPNGKKETNRAIQEKKPGTEQHKALQDAQQELTSAPASFSSQRSQYLGELLSKHTTDAFSFDSLFESSKAITTFDNEEARKAMATEIFLGVIPGASAIRHLIQGKPLEALGDVVFDGVMYATTLGFGKAAGAAKGLNGLKSTRLFGKALGKAASNAGNFVTDAANGVRRGAGAVVAQLRPGIRKVDLVELAKRPNVAEGTYKAANKVDSIRGTARLDEATGKWYHYDPATRRAYGMPIDFTPEAAPALKKTTYDKLQIKFDTQITNAAEDAGLCFHRSSQIARAESTISAKAYEAINSSKLVDGYPKGYRDFMGIAPDTIKHTFNPADITESGFINFIDKNANGKVVHTAYIQRTVDNKLYLYNSNQITLDAALIRTGDAVHESRSVRAFNLDNSKQQALQTWLDVGDNIPGLVGHRYDFAFTPASTLNRNIEQLAH